MNERMQIGIPILLLGILGGGGAFYIVRRGASAIDSFGDVFNFVLLVLVGLAIILSLIKVIASVILKIESATLNMPLIIALVVLVGSIVGGLAGVLTIP